MRAASLTLTLLALVIPVILATPHPERLAAPSAADPARGAGAAPGARPHAQEPAHASAKARDARAQFAAPAPSPLPIEAAARQAIGRQPAQLPGTLELVTLGARAGGRAPASKRIARAEAVAATIGSREYQDTVSPIARLYFAAMQRFPDYEGLNYYTGQREEARTLEAIADEFAGSREFEQRYGTLDNAEFVARILANVIGHESQADVRAYWTGELDAGRMSRGQVLADLAESGAFRERSAHQVFVSTAYTEILQRTPDPAGYARWVAHLDAGNSYQSVIDGLLASR